MKILRRHIGMTVIYATLIVLFVLLGLEVFIAFVKQLHDIGIGDYGLWQAVQYVVLSMPMDLYNFFPMAGLLGCLLGLGYLASNSELIIMRASGVSLMQISQAVLRAAIILLIAMVMIGELLGPSGMHRAETKKVIAKTGGQAIKVSKGLWIRDGNDFIHISHIVPGFILQGISRYQFDKKNRLRVASYAKKAVFHDGYWILNDVLETQFNKYSVTKLHVPQKKWLAKINLELLNVADVDPNELSLVKLSQVIQYRRANGLSIGRYALIFWQRIFRPASMLVMIFLAIPFIFGPLRTVTMGVRIVTGVIVGFSFYLINQFFGPLSLVYQVPPIIGAIFPSFIFLLVGLLFMRRVF